MFAGLVVEARCTVDGTAQVKNGRFVVWNALYRLEPEDWTRHARTSYDTSAHP
jgi:hypothetical protein